MHAAAISALLSFHEFFFESPTRQIHTVTYWISLPAIPEKPATAAPLPSPGLPMSPLLGETGEFGPSGLPAPASAPPAFSALPALSLPSPNSTALLYLGDYLACSFIDYDKQTDAERQRCTISLANLGDVTPLPSEYAETPGTPFRLFGARGMLLITPATEPGLSLMDVSRGCVWQLRVCQPLLPPDSGIDPDDKTRGSLLAVFDLGHGFTLYAGMQGYMQNFLGGAQFGYTSGIRVAYRW